MTSSEHLPENVVPLPRAYAVRSVRANPYDSVCCVRLSQAAVHAAMSGRTQMVVGRYRRRVVHIPMATAVSRRNMVDPRGGTAVRAPVRVR